MTGRPRLHGGGERVGDDLRLVLHQLTRPDLLAHRRGLIDQEHPAHRVRPRHLRHVAHADTHCTGEVDEDGVELTTGTGAIAAPIRSSNSEIVIRPEQCDDHRREDLTRCQCERYTSPR